MRLLADFKPVIATDEYFKGLSPAIVERNKKRFEVLTQVSNEIGKVYIQAKCIDNIRLHIVLHKLIELTMEINPAKLEKYELKFKKTLPDFQNLTDLFKSLKVIHSILTYYRKNIDEERINTAETFLANTARMQSIHLECQKAAIIDECGQYLEDLNFAYNHKLITPKAPKPEYLAIYNRACPNIDIAARNYERKHFPTDEDKKAFLKKLKK